MTYGLWKRSTWSTVAFLKKSVCGFFLGLTITAAHGGSVEGPHLVWINLAPSPQTGNAILREFLSGSEQLCWNDGFGIVVYAEDRKPMLYSLTTGKTNVQSDTVDRPLHLKGAFCNVIPPTVRKP